VYFANSELVAVDLASGTQRWRRPIDFDRPVLTGNAQVVASYRSRMVSFDPESGEQRWERRLKRYITALTADSDGIYAGTFEGRVAHVAPESGEIRWQVVPKPRPTISYLGGGDGRWVLATAEGVVLAGRPEGKRIYGLDAATGETGWCLHASGWGGQLSAITVSDGIAYFGTRDMYAVEVTTGGVRWKYRPERDASAATPAGSSVYFGGGAHLYAADATTGEVRWRHPVDQWLGTAPTVANELVYVVDVDAAVTTLRA
jgi:outer membrane protein assembly factor BamB